MKRLTLHRWRTGFAVLLLLTLLAGCGSTTTAVSTSSAPMDASMDSAEMEERGEWAAEPATAFGTDTTSQTVPTANARKLIYTANLSLETTSFDQTVSDLSDLTAQCGGYFESSSVDTWSSGYRHASYTVRIPSGQYRTFLEQAGSLCHQLNYSEYVDDVSSAYYDVAGRLKTQQTKLERLQELLSQAKDMADIITLESAISETEETIERLSGTLKDYDAQVDESTIQIDLDEVYKLSNVEEPATGFFSRIGNALVSGWKGFCSAAEGFLIALAYSWMWLLLLGIVVVVLVRARKHKKPFQPPKKTADKPDDKSE